MQFKWKLHVGKTYGKSMELPWNFHAETPRKFHELFVNPHGVILLTVYGSIGSKLW